MKKQRLFALLSAAALLTGLMSGCGEIDDPTPIPPPPDPIVTEPVEDPAEQPAEKPEDAPAEPESDIPPEAEESLQEIRRSMEPSDAIAGILYLGFWDQGPLNSDFFATLDPQLYLEKYAFLAQMTDAQLIANDGCEVYCIIPADPEATVLVTQWQELEEHDYKPEPGEVLYESDNGQPFLLQANVSDLISNVAVTISDSRGFTLENYQPQISLRDGTVILSREDQPVVLDFTEYSQPAPEGPVMGSYELYVPNEAADGLDQILLEDQLIDATYVLPLLVAYDVLPEDLVLNAFSQEGSDLYLDLGISFADYLNTMGSTGELLTLGSLVNSFLSAFGADTITITVDGASIETGHNIYNEPFTFMTIAG